MPISKERMKLYPGGSIHSYEWKEIRNSILIRAEGQCESCGVDDRILVTWEDGKWWTVTSTEDCKAVFIVLTIAHLNHDPTDNRSDNLKALCQRCHNGFDREQRQANAKLTRISRKTHPLFDNV